VTILRDAEQALRRPLAQPITWHVDEFVLIDSQPPEPYRVTGRWPLA
jgi:2'-5' RNA ligase